MCPRLLWARLLLMTNWSAGLSGKITGSACSSLASRAQVEVSSGSPRGIVLTSWVHGRARGTWRWCFAPCSSDLFPRSVQNLPLLSLQALSSVWLCGWALCGLVAMAVWFPRTAFYPRGCRCSGTAVCYQPAPLVPREILRSGNFSAYGCKSG